MPSRRETYDPFKDPYIHLRPLPPGTEEADTAPSYDDDLRYPSRQLPPAPGRRIDWSEAARLLARGRPVEQVASQLSCKPVRIWRNLKRSKRFRDRIELEHERLRLQSSLRFRDLGAHCIRQIERRTEKLDPKTLLWLAQTLGLGQLPRRGMGQGIGELFGAVAVEGEAPPRPAGRTEKVVTRLRELMLTGNTTAAAALAKVEMARHDAVIALSKTGEDR